nr:MAG TPA: hypothetical protein [Caudoviricetes sp.]
MERMEPTHKEIMKYLDCCYYGYGHKGICECRSPNQFKGCYEAAKKRLTRTVLTEEEIKKGQEANAKAMLEIERALAILSGDIEE